MNGRGHRCRCGVALDIDGLSASIRPYSVYCTTCGHVSKIKIQ